MWVAQCNTHIMTLNPHYLRQKTISYLHDNLNMHTLDVGDKMQYSHYDLKSILSMGNQNANPYVKHGTFLMEFDDYVKSSKEIDLDELGTNQQN